MRILAFNMICHTILVWNILSGMKIKTVSLKKKEMSVLKKQSMPLHTEI